MPKKWESGLNYINMKHLSIEPCLKYEIENAFIIKIMEKKYFDERNTRSVNIIYFLDIGKKKLHCETRLFIHFMCFLSFYFTKSDSFHAINFWWKPGIKIKVYINESFILYLQKVTYWGVSMWTTYAFIFLSHTLLRR